MKRRQLLVAAGPWLAGCVAAPVHRAGADTRAGADAADAADVALVDRVTWGADSASLAELARLGRRDYLHAQLHPDAEASLPPWVDAQIGALPLLRQPMLAWAFEMRQRRRAADALADDDARKAARLAYQQDLNRLARDAATRSLLRALYAPQQLQEQLTWFWFNHFNVYQHKADLAVMVGDYEDHLRTHALGRFRDLLLASATHAAMVRYLDNEQNTAGHLNENYAREVMELHTLGVDGGYAQQDVQELARVLTGLGLDFGDTAQTKPGARAVELGGAAVFRPARHDAGAKRLLGASVEGRGWDEIEAQLTRLARHPATAAHISRKLAVYLVADAPPAPLVERMSRAFVASDGDIAVTLQAMFDAPGFAPSLARKFKDPVHWVVSAVRLVGDGHTVTDCGPMLGWLNRLGEGLYNRQTPDGYALDEAAWSGSGQMSTRFEIAGAIASGQALALRADGRPEDARPWSAGPAALALQARLGARSRAALAAAESAQQRDALLLSTPQFMFR